MSIRGGLLANTKAKEATITAVITRADGTVEDLGVIAYWHKNPVRRALWSFRTLILKAVKGTDHGCSRPE